MRDKYIVWVNGIPYLVDTPTLEATNSVVRKVRGMPLDETDKIDCVMRPPVLEATIPLQEDFKEHVVNAAVERRRKAAEERALNKLTE